MNEKLFGKKPKHYRLKKHISQTQFIAYGFFLIIMTGSLLLMLPIASRDGQSEPFLNCLFTATSASCVTGLVVADTWTQWSLFGQMVLLVLILLVSAVQKLAEKKLDSGIRTSKRRARK